jgi:hypothetical protein
MDLRKCPAMRIVGCLFFISLCATQGVQAQWSRVTLPAIPRALVFSDSLLGYFVSNQEYGFHSLDGGKDWIMVGAGLGGSLSFDEFDIGHSLNDGSATFPTQAAELRLNSDSIFWSDHVPQWYRTLGEIMYDSSYGFRMVQIISGFGTLSDSLRILVTHDDWYTSDYYGSPVVDPGFNPSGSYYTVNAARFIDSNEVWFAYGPRLIHTRDAFTFWTSTLCITDTVRNKPVWGKIYAFPKSHELYAVSLWTLAPNNIAYVYSSDDGLTWRSDSTLGGNVQFSNIPSPNQLWLMRGLYAEGSKLSTLYHSTDKGMTWSRICFGSTIDGDGSQDLREKPAIFGTLVQLPGSNKPPQIKFAHSFIRTQPRTKWNLSRLDRGISGSSMSWAAFAPITKSSLAKTGSMCLRWQQVSTRSSLPIAVCALHPNF